jgi:hypothetical protein
MLRHAGAILHYNIDKAFLMAGQCRNGFGGGRHHPPDRIHRRDRATLALGDPPATTLPVEDTVRSAVETWVGRHLPHLRSKEHLPIRTVLAPASAELRAIQWGGERELEAKLRGTLAFADRIGPEALGALERALRAGLRLILVTGRTFFDLTGDVFSDRMLCHQIRKLEGRWARGEIRDLRPWLRQLVALRHGAEQ